MQFAESKLVRSPARTNWAYWCDRPLGQIGRMGAIARSDKLRLWVRSPARTNWAYWCDRPLGQIARMGAIARSEKLRVLLRSGAADKLPQNLCIFRQGNDIPVRSAGSF